MDLSECYKLLRLSGSAGNQEIIRAYKRLAHKYHPDKNRDKIKWATGAMTNLNIAYTTILSRRFGDANIDETELNNTVSPEENVQDVPEEELSPQDDLKSVFNSDILTKKFVRIRESAKDVLYRYFQYGLYNMARREELANRRRFNEVVFTLRKCFHGLKELSNHSEDEDFIEHFDIFRNMLFHFYKGSECMNILDSYSNTIDVEAYRLYKHGDDALHSSHKEIFYDRHNRGYFKRDISISLIADSENYFKNTLKAFPGSTWAVETKIKLDYTSSLVDYLELFFNE